MTTKGDAKTVATASIENLANCAAEIVGEVLNGMPPAIRKQIAKALDHGRLTLMVTVHPRLQVIVALDPNSASAAPVRLASWIGDAPEPIKELLH